MAREKGGPHYVWGICTNLDKDGNGNPCPNCKSKEKLKLSIRDEFVCPECGEPLTKVKGPVGPNWKLIGIIAAAIVVLIGVGYGIFSIYGGSNIDNIKLDKKDIALTVGQKDFIKATVVDKDGNVINTKVVYKWLVDDEKVATVTQDGEVTAQNEGKTTVTARIDGDDLHVAICQVEVKGETPSDETFIEDISIKDAADFSLKKGDTKQLQCEATPESNSETPEWVSSDPNVATVDATGLVTAVKKGKAQISVSAQKVKSASITVTVTEDSGKGGGTGGGTSTGGGLSVLNGAATYTGGMSGGKPHGNGIVRFHKSSNLDGKHIPANSRIEGVFREGWLNLGTLFTPDGDAIVMKDIKLK